MDCPRCKCALVQRTHDGIRIDQCEGCKGMFLHRGELNRLSPTTPGDLEFSTLHDESFQHADRFGPISCPACADRPMKKVEFNIHSGIVLDFCADCGGFWLDGHELERIGEEVRQLEQTDDSGPGHRMQWFAQFLWSLPR